MVPNHWVNLWSKFLSLASFEQCFFSSKIATYTFLHKARNIKLHNYKNSSENFLPHVGYVTSKHLMTTNAAEGGGGGGDYSCIVTFSLMQFKLVYYEEQALWYIAEWAFGIV